MSSWCSTEPADHLAAATVSAEREAGRAELAALARTVLAWKESYIRLEYQDAAIDFMEEIDNLVYPYLKRLFECGYIDETQFRLFLNFCDQQMNEISKSGKEVF